MTSIRELLLLLTLLPSKLFLLLWILFLKRIDKGRTENSMSKIRSFQRSISSWMARTSETRRVAWGLTPEGVVIDEMWTCWKALSAPRIRPLTLFPEDGDK